MNSWTMSFDWTDTNGQRVVRAINYSPTLYRTTTEAVATKPPYVSGKKWATWMRANFPAWRYNATTWRWHGPLADLDKMIEMFPHASQSEGVKAYLAKKGNDHENS